VGSRKTQKYILLLFLSYLSWASNYLEWNKDSIVYDFLFWDFLSFTVSKHKDVEICFWT
jgi:hypothetical protein